jgi:hypothetical protein
VAKPKDLTREQLQARKEKAERFKRDVLDDPERADETAEERLESYAERRRIRLLNSHERRAVIMATVKELQQEIGDLEEIIDEVTAILEDVYTPEASREDLAEAIGNTLDVLSGEEEEEEDEEEGAGEDEE